LVATGQNPSLTNIVQKQRTAYTESAITECLTTFRPLASNVGGAQLFKTTKAEDNDENSLHFDEISLNRPFFFKGTDPILVLIIEENGTIRLKQQDRSKDRQAMSTVVTEEEMFPRILVAEGEYSSMSTFKGGKGVYWNDTGSSVLVSWEPRLVAGGRVQVNFQVELFDNGNIQMTWRGVGPIGDTIPVRSGIKDGRGLMLAPLTGSPFQEGGFSQYPSVFSQDTCRLFSAVQEQELTL
jgi:hypothetical protein